MRSNTAARILIGAAPVILAWGVLLAADRSDARDTALMTYADYLRATAAPRPTIEKFLDPASPTWAKFDPELGYVLGKSLPRDGMDGSNTISTAQANGARTQLHYADRPCRINTYGDSFTLCHQASDGETWQEVLAAHFGEPIRNFGMGGYGTYQAYRRMVREEGTDHASEYVIFYLWGDDHLRSIMRARWATFDPAWRDAKTQGIMFHNNFWANIEMDPETGKWSERPNLLPTPADLYKMCDPEFMAETLKDDLMVQLHSVVSGRVDPTSIDLDAIGRLAGHLGIEGPDRSGDDALRRSLGAIMQAYGFASTAEVLRLAEAFCARNSKKLLVLTLDPAVIRQLLAGKPRQDQPLQDILVRSGIRHIDMNLAHLKDFASFKITPDEYMHRYFIGHYNPAGNHFFAFALKPELVLWLEPMPPTYRGVDSNTVTFKGYLPE